MVAFADTAISQAVHLAEMALLDFIARDLSPAVGTIGHVFVHKIKRYVVE